jgi:hypothetical protein
VAEPLGILLLQSAAAMAQIMNLGHDVIESQGWLRPTDVHLARIGPEGPVGGGTRASLKLELSLPNPPPRAMAPSVLILMHGGPWGLTDDAALWMTRVRLGGSYRFHVPPGNYAMAALYIAAHTSRHVTPDLLAVGESFSDVAIGDRRTVPLSGRLPTAAHLSTISGAPQSQKLFTVRHVSRSTARPTVTATPPARPAVTATAPSKPAVAVNSPAKPAVTASPPVVPVSPARPKVIAGTGPLYRCRAQQTGQPHLRCNESHRGADVCTRHTFNGIDFATGQPIPPPPAPLPPPAPTIAPAPPAAQVYPGTRNGQGLLYRCRAQESAQPRLRCNESQRGSDVCPRHTYNGVDFATGQPIPPPPAEPSPPAGPALQVDRAAFARQGPLFRCRAQEIARPDGRCNESQRGSNVCPRHSFNGIDFLTGLPILSPPAVR